MEWTAVDSTNIDSIGYDSDTMTLRILFRAGLTYEYGNVSEFIYKAFLKSGSKGQYFNNNIKNKYSYKRV